MLKEFLPFTTSNMLPSSTAITWMLLGACLGITPVFFELFRIELLNYIDKVKRRRQSESMSVTRLFTCTICQKRVDMPFYSTHMARHDSGWFAESTEEEPARLRAEVR